MIVYVLKLEIFTSSTIESSVKVFATNYSAFREMNELVRTALLLYPTADFHKETIDSSTIARLVPKNRDIYYKWTITKEPVIDDNEIA